MLEAKAQVGSGADGSSGDRVDDADARDRPFHEDAHRAIATMGPAAGTLVSTGVWLHLGHWIGWPCWLTEGTTLTGRDDLPPAISAADDLLVAANVVERMGMADPLRRVIEHARPALGPRAALLYVSAPNLGEALAGMCCASNTNHPYMHLEIVRGQRGLDVHVEPKVDMGRLADFLMPLAALTLCKVVESIASERMEAVELRTSLGATCVPPAFWSNIRCRVSAGSAVNRLHIPAELADLPNPESDPTMWLLAQENFRHQAQAHPGGSLTVRVRKRVMHLLAHEGQAPRLKQIAAEQGLSSRTIIRALSDEGTTFFDLVEQERRKLAAELIANPLLSLDTVATKLGFSDKSSFGRAFRKWFGTPPGYFRERAAMKAVRVSHSAAACSLLLPIYEPALNLF
ncbi:helix-turn-helix domain-containing protein [Novosphingobium mathurense]|uniref:AraC-type DNA-binding protein n=1 Tax=Novosphingobium mathurense TaxID=428990 RepID=A0A1U6IC28_9SPHN|nr:AraC family transcriptional regulator [Novosphingobium mathurense]SLK05549.1 AraC-type DNA-binding protein [Novosphingobium mathurense]